ncbi:methionine/alanine import family NSS transporter small subunit [Rodentibacter myodis]|nr:methionine/alanine import family NSS transporter small subunit [Rodentibacter myodis]
MSSSAIIMMVIALGVIWGGFFFALLRLPKENK